MKPSMKWIAALAIAATPALAVGQMQGQQPGHQPSQPGQMGQPQTIGQQPGQQQGQQMGQQQPGEYDIASFITAQTEAVARVNLDRFDRERFEQWGREFIRDLDVEGERGQVAAAQLGAAYGQVQAWASNMKQAGAEEVYVLLVGGQAQQGQAGRMGQLVPIIVIPDVEQDQEQTLRTLLQPADGQDQMRLESARIRDAMVFYPQQAQQVVTQLQQPPVADQQAQELRLALNEATGAAIAMAFRPDSQIAQMGQQAGLDQTQLRDLEWVSIGIHYPQQGDRGFEMTLKARDEEQAEAFAHRWNERLREMGDREDDAERAQLAGAQLAEKHSDALEPEVRGDRLVITLSDEQANEILRDSLKAMFKAQENDRDRE